MWGTPQAVTCRGDSKEEGDVGWDLWVAGLRLRESKACLSRCFCAVLSPVLATLQALLLHGALLSLPPVVYMHKPFGLECSSRYCLRSSLQNQSYLPAKIETSTLKCT